MAIKGKGKTRSRRVIAAPPRPALVVRKPPMWRRAWVRVVAGLLVAGGIAFVLTGLAHSHGVKAKRNREILAVQKYVNLVRDAMPPDRSAVPPDLVVIFPSVGDDLPKIGTDITGASAVKRGREIIDQATAATDAFDAIDVAGTIPAEFPDVRAEFTDAQFLMSQAMTVYERVGQLVQIAADANDKAQRESLIEQAQQLIQQAGSMFDAGYVKVVRLAKDLGISINIPFVPPPTSPGGQGGATPTPSPSESATPTPTPTPTESATPTPAPTTSPEPTPSASG